MKENTVEYWISKFPKGYDKLAYKYASLENRLNEYAISRADALEAAFEWENTDEKYHFWNNVFRYLNEVSEDLPDIGENNENRN